MSADPNLHVALELAAAGITIFPADAHKRPLIKNWDEASSSDPQKIKWWWRIRGGALATIDLRKAGLIVIDADRHGGPDGVANWWKLVREHEADFTACPTVTTPNDGLHVYFRQPPGDPLGNRRGVMPPAVDVKGAGGSITAPGCIRPDGTFYESIGPDLAAAFKAGTIPPVPDWLVTIIRAPRATEKPTQRVDDPPPYSCGSRFERYARAALAGRIADVSATTIGGRNNALNAAAFRLGQLAGRQWLNPTAIEHGLFKAAEANGLLAEDGPASVMATIRSGMHAGLASPAADPGERR